MLAGSHAWHSGEFDACTPRSLVPVLNVPLILHTLNWLKQAGISTIVLCVNHEGHRFRRFFGDGAALDLDLYYQEDHLPRGPAGCAFDASQIVDADQFVVVEANSIHLLSLHDLLASHQDAGESGTVVVERSTQRNPQEEKSFRPAGIYVLERTLLNHVPDCGFIDIKEWLIPELYRNDHGIHRFNAMRIAPRVHDIASYLQINYWALNEMIKTAQVSTGPNFHCSIVLDDNVQIAPSARIVGPCLIGRNTIIEEDVMIIGPTIIGRNCTIGSGAMVHNSVMWDRASVRPGAVANGLIRARW
ncbi:MAG: NDP-sugar synthase [Planctomycetes bacterium]|nr:NDP-sugar synthase [Planctomycetota bacterium]